MTILCCVFLDLWAGFMFIPAQPGVWSPHYHHDLKVSYKAVERWGPTSYELRTNSMGFRDQDTRTVKLSDSRYRILFLGDSFTQGLGCAYEKTFVGLTANSLGPNEYEVLNGGVVSYSPKLYHLKLKYLLEVKKMKLDAVVVFLDISDIQDEIVYGLFYPDQLQSGMPIHAFLKNNSLIYYAINGFFDIPLDRHKDVSSQISAGLRSMCKRMRNLVIPEKEIDVYEKYASERAEWAYDKEVFDKWGRKGLGLATAHMEKIHDLCVSNKIPLLMAIYPWPCQILRRELASIHTEHWAGFCAAKNIPLLNYFPVFINMPDKTPPQVIDNYFLSGDVHWNEQGHQLIAEQLKPWLTAHLK